MAMQSIERLPAPQRRQQILDTALQLFSEKGYSATSTRLLSQQIGVSEALIFRYFATKRDILLALIDAHDLSEVEAECASILARTDYGDEQQWTAGIALLLRYLRKNSKLLRIVYDESQRDEQVARAYLEQVLARLSKPFMQYVEAKIASGEYRQVNAEILARTLFGAVFNVLITEDWLKLADNGHLSEEQVGCEVASVFLHGLVPRVARA